MKLLTAIFMLMFAICSFAQTSQSSRVIYDGTQSTLSTNFSGIQTHTEYRYEQRQTICYRTETHYRRVCHQTPNGPICQSFPETRTVSYPCIQTVQIPYQVKDYDVFANVEINVQNLTDEQAGESFNVSLVQDQVSLDAVSPSKRFFIVLKAQEIASSISGSSKYITAKYSAVLVKSAPIVAALSVSNISLSNPVLSFTTGPVSSLDYIGYALTVVKAPIFGSNTVLFDRELFANEVSLSGNGSAAQVSLEQLGVQLASGRNTLTAKIFFKHGGKKVLNAEQFDALSAERT